VFIPGQRMSSANGEFVPGVSVRSPDDRLQFVPGVFDAAHFVAGQFIADGSGEMRFVHGQVVHTTKAAKFVEGRTVQTPDGVKMIAG
jgi:hypothetical protein